MTKIVILVGVLWVMVCVLAYRAPLTSSSAQSLWSKITTARMEQVQAIEQLELK